MGKQVVFFLFFFVLLFFCFFFVFFFFGFVCVVGGSHSVRFCGRLLLAQAMVIPTPGRSRNFIDLPS